MRTAAAAPPRTVALAGGARAKSEGFLFLGPAYPAASTAFHLNLFKLVIGASIVVEAVVTMRIALCNIHDWRRAAAAAAAAAAYEDAQEQQAG